MTGAVVRCAGRLDVVDPRKLLERVARGNVANVRFRDLLRLASALGFRTSRVAGSHHILVHPGSREILNLQDVGGDAKPYQVRQLLRLVERYNLRLERNS
jgi:predicted RNA binding protein YcfA (HicA-like mRNA interferase family)